MAREPLLIADAGPIILLAAIGRFELLCALGLEVLIPRSVYDEVVAGAPRPGSEEVRNASWLQVVDGPADVAEAFRLMVDRGEAEALSLAKSRPGSLLVVDDLRARRIAVQLALRHTGTLGILGMAKRSGLIAEVAPEVERLRRAGFRLTTALVTEFLRRLGESPA